MTQRKKTSAIAAAVLGIAIGTSVGCLSEGRSEPGYGDNVCHVRGIVCHTAENVAKLEVGSPAWAYCATQPVVAIGGLAARGRNESWFTWGADGAIEEVRTDCREGGEVRQTAERDEQGRIALYHDSWNDRILRFEYGDDNLPHVATSEPATGSLGPYQFSTQHYAWSYDSGPRLIVTSQHTEGYLVEPNDHQVTLAYQADLLSSIDVRATGWTEYETTTEVIRDGDRIVEIDRPATTIVGSRARFEWVDDEHMRSTVDWVLGTIEGRHTFVDGKVSYVEEDLDGEPLTTSWYEYDDDGRLEHLIWWGHFPPDPQ